MKTAIFQFNGCDKCFNQAVLLDDVKQVKNPKEWKSEKLDVAVIAGYLTPDDKEIVEKIGANSSKIIAFGSCSATGGIFGLAYQNGITILPTHKILNDVVEVKGCLGEVEELKNAIEGKDISSDSKLCDSCSRKSTCGYLDEVHRFIDVTEDEEQSCYNDLGFICDGYIAQTCKELCVNSGAPCRGCKPFVERPGFRMLGMFGTLLGNIEVATEATGKGGTDKLADVEDEVSESVPDVVGNFFRFTLADTALPIGRIESVGDDIVSNVMVGRPIEELPSIMGMMGGSNFISKTLDILEAYEKGAEINASDSVKADREKLKAAEKKMQDAISKSDAKMYKEAEAEIRKLAGNMNLSKLYYGGYRTVDPIEMNFEDEFPEGSYSSGSVSFKLDPKGIVTEFKI